MTTMTGRNRKFPLYALCAALVACLLIPATTAFAYTEFQYAYGTQSGWGVIRASTQGTIEGGRVYTAGSLWTVQVDTWRPFPYDSVAWSAVGIRSVAGSHLPVSSSKSRCWWTYGHYVSGTQPLFCWKRV
jgi:hypothetical protein